MKLLLTNGYPFPFIHADADACAERADENTLELFDVVSFEWKHTITVEFDNADNYRAAKALTGWQDWHVSDGCYVLEAQFSEPDGYRHPAICVAGIAYCGFNVLAE